MSYEHMNKGLYFAHKYAKKGWPVLPISKNTKIPLIKGWQQNSTTSHKVIDIWWKQRFIDSNIGIVTGKRSNIFVVDIDIKAGGMKSFENLQKIHGEIPKTIKSYTGGGGIHFIFSLNGYDICNSVRKLGKGIDIRGNNGMIVVPPSVHKSGKEYQWDDICHPWFTDAADPPQWLINKIKKRQQKQNNNRVTSANEGTALTLINQAIDIVKKQDGGRNEVGFWLCTKLRDYGFAIDNARFYMSIYQDQVPMFDHPYETEELNRSVNNAYSVILGEK